MNLQICHFHADEGIMGNPVSGDGTLTFTCPRTSGHPQPGPYTWFQAPPPPDSNLGELATDLRLAVELPAALKAFRGQWVEYGVLEHAYAKANPDDFALLVDRYGHTAIKEKRYTASAFLAKSLGDLSRYGDVLYHEGPATGRWDYLSKVSWWAIAPEPDWSTRMSWADTGLGMDYVPGNQEA
jgi:hypothetical protein